MSAATTYRVVVNAAAPEAVRGGDATAGPADRQGRPGTVEMYHLVVNAAAPSAGRDGGQAQAHSASQG